MVVKPVKGRRVRGMVEGREVVAVLAAAVRVVAVATAVVAAEGKAEEETAAETTATGGQERIGIANGF